MSSLRATLAAVILAFFPACDFEVAGPTSAPDAATCLHCGEDHAPPACPAGEIRSDAGQPCHAVPHYGPDAGVDAGP